MCLNKCKKYTSLCINKQFVVKQFPTDYYNPARRG